MKDRTKAFAVRTWTLCSNIPKSREFNAYVNQLIRCSSSVGANYRASQRAKSRADFIHKLKIVEEEIDESMYFLELLIEISQNNLAEMKSLHTEATEILAIVVSSIKTARSNGK
ncbi:four helix bundle protein [Allomuricauda sp. NBRC 101325]|uniref:four helix bundle protein n=1 Tax=Allomuricauda sp. NBRC 101325 TaxID=1113758 RepID=UPI00255515D0|nr:four helix bundle protein [Muricauda sp. NBRC 101325]